MEPRNVAYSRCATLMIYVVVYNPEGEAVSHVRWARGNRGRFEIA